MNNPLISIITVTYNAQDFLEQTMQSVFAQTYSNIEYLIIDGCSQDNTVSIIKKQESKLSYWVSEKDLGVYDAMNKGIRLCKGELIGMINASDYYAPNAVELVVNEYLSNNSDGIFHGNINMLNADGSFFKLKKPDTDLSELYKGISLFHPTFFVSKSIYEKQGLYDIRYKIAADFDFALRCYLAGVHFYYIDNVISNFRLGGLSSNRNNDGMAESRDILIKNGFDNETVQSMVKLWKKLDLKNRKYNIAYNILGKIFPAFIIEKIAAHISVK
ncbi:hypothetical protein AGMMS50262_11610 [Bacteroidia bacterium]|nr:hypothetical protein AGMMS50262_11610 [Bacteroidia bacterium]